MGISLRVSALSSAQGGNWIAGTSDIRRRRIVSDCPDARDKCGTLSSYAHFDEAFLEGLVVGEIERNVGLALHCFSCPDDDGVLRFVKPG